MQLLNSVFALTLLAAGFLQVSALAPRSVLNGPCTGAGGAPGVCISKSSCSGGGGVSIVGACPGTPDDIRCCVKTACGSGGNCRWTSQCSGTTATGLCPGPANFKCCEAKGSGGTLPGLNSVQTGHARTIISRAKANFASSLQKRACEVAIATAMQESSIRVLANPSVPASYNYPHDGSGSDHDSVGIFQQRASWGTVKDRMNPVCILHSPFGLIANECAVHKR